MRRWKGIGALVLALALAAALLLPALGAEGEVNLMAVNERVLETTAENMPRTVGGVLYVPYTMLSNQVNGINLGVSALYSPTRRTVAVTDSRRGIIFDIQSGTAQDLSGAQVPARAMVRNATVFLPIDWLCQYFGSIKCTRTRTPYGTLIRITNSAVILSDRDFADAADSQLADSLQRYLASGGRGEGVNPAPSGGVESSQPPSGAELFLALRCGPCARECAQQLEERELRGLFLFDVEGLAEQGDLARRLAGAGHALGLTVEGGSAERCLAEAERGRKLLAAAARYDALILSAPGLDEEGREALARAGYVVWTATAREEDASSGPALVRGLDTRQVNFVELACGDGGPLFLRAALNAMEERNCQVHQATAPALSE